ncbi:Intraflagellar transport protein 46, partial [Nowakowskiella sp. JEL0078]
YTIKPLTNSYFDEIIEILESHSSSSSRSNSSRDIINQSRGDSPPATSWTHLDNSSDEISEDQDLQLQKLEQKSFGTMKKISYANPPSYSQHASSRNTNLNKSTTSSEGNSPTSKSSKHTDDQESPKSNNRSIPQNEKSTRDPQYHESAKSNNESELSTDDESQFDYENDEVELHLSDNDAVVSEASYDRMENFMDKASNMKELLTFITRYKSQEVELETELKPFLPDFIPAIGDIDAFIKIPPPSVNGEYTGLTSLDEPSGEQSDPSVLDLHLRSITKSTVALPQHVRSIPSERLREGGKFMDNWIKSIEELHTKKPAPNVDYSKRMPDIEHLMQIWDPSIEEALEKLSLPSAELNVSLSEYSKVVLSMLDIPVNNLINESKKLVPGGTIQSMHILFMLYSEFKNSHHFKALERSMGGGGGSIASAAPAAETQRM